jgi:hypothetical protein
MAVRSRLTSPRLTVVFIHDRNPIGKQALDGTNDRVRSAGEAEDRMRCGRCRRGDLGAKAYCGSAKEM